MVGTKRGLLLRSFRIDPALGGDRVERLPFLRHGPVSVRLESPLTLRDPAGRRAELCRV
jgi:hypothetical protein